MIRTSDCCRLSPTNNRTRLSRTNAAGFTLPEVLVVLVIMGLVLGSAGTRMGSYQVRTQLENEARSLSAVIQRVQYANLVTGKTRLIDTDFIESMLRSAMDPQSRLLGPPPDGLAITVTAPVKVGQDGACSDGSYLLAWRDMRFALRFTAPLCEAAITRLD